MTLLPQSFFARPCVEVARDLVGVHLVRDDVTVRITETEAYRQDDTGSHCKAGRTARNAAMWGPPGRCYVYVIYGRYPMLNLTTEDEGVCAAVLIRAAEPVHGVDAIRARRGPLDGPTLLAGPGRVAVALGLDKTWNHHALYEPGGLEAHAGTPPHALSHGPRIGIDYACDADRELAWRFADADSRWVTHRRKLERMAM